MKILAMQIEKLRKRKRLTQVQLAEMVGVRQASVSQWESGNTIPSTSKLPIIANALSVRIEELYCAEDKEEQAQSEHERKE